MTTEKKAKTAREALLMAADLLSKRGAWCKGDLAHDSGGESVSPFSKKAVAFCMMGAIERVATPSALNKARVILFSEGKDGTWNDVQKSKRPVIAALRKAAEL